MAQRIGRSRRKTKHKFSQYYKDKGKISLSQYFQELNVGDKVSLNVNPAVTKGRYFRRFHGQTGEVTGQRGRCYQVAVFDGSKQKIFNVHPIHLKKL